MSNFGSFLKLALVGVAYAINPAAGSAAQYWLMAAQVALSVADAQYDMRRAKRQARRDYNAGLEDRLEMVDVTPDQARTLVYGRVRTVEGVRRRWVSGENNRRLTMIVSFAGHEIDGFEKFYFDDNELTLDAQGWVTSAPYLKGNLESAFEQSFDPVVTLPTLPVAGSVSVMVAAGAGVDREEVEGVVLSVAGNVVTCQVDPRLNAQYTVSYQAASGQRTARVRFWTGAPGQNVGAQLAAEYPGKITANDRFEGMAVAAVDIDYDPDVYVQGRPNVTALLRGMRCYDPRQDSTNGGNGPQRLALPATWTWTETVALQSADYARRASGQAIPDAEVSWPHVAQAANVCDQPTTYTLRKPDNSTSQVTMARFRGAVVIKCEGSRRSGMDELMTAMAGREGWAGGLWVCRAGAMGAPVFALTESWVAQRLDDSGEPDTSPVIRITNGVTREQRVNRITGRCIDPAQRWQALPYPAVQDSVLVSQWGAVFPLELDQAAVPHPAQAQHVGSIRIRESQAALRLAATCNVSAWRCELLDVGTVTLPRMGMAGKTFEVVGWRWHPAEGVQLSLAEISAAMFEPLAELRGVDPAPNSDLPPPWDVQQITGVTVVSGTDALRDGSILTRTRVSWAPCTQASVLAGGSIEVQYCELATGEWASWTEQGAATEATIPGLRAGVTHLFKVRAVQGLPLVRGPWSLQVQHRVAPVPVVDGRFTDFIFRRSATAPATPVGESPAGWFGSPPAADGNPLWFSMAPKASDGALLAGWSVPVAIDGEALQVEYSSGELGPWVSEFVPGHLYARYRVGAAGAWSAAIKIVGEDGLTPVYIFRRAASAPATPVGDFPAGWFDGPPLANGQPLFASVNRRRANGTVVGAWSVPVQIEGDSVYVEYSANGVNGWHPVFGPGDLYARYRTGTAGAWSDAVRIVGEDGQPGANGTRMATLTLYQWASAPPTVWPSGTSSYTWASGAFTTPSGAGLWTQTPGAPLAGQTLYACVQRQADTGTAPVTGIAWNTTSAIVVGRAGTDGVRGSVTGYSASVSPPIFSTGPWAGAADDTNARDIIWRMRGGAGSAPSNAHLVIGDTVTLRNAANTAVATRYWTGSSWDDQGAVVSGSAIVGGTISGQTNLNIAGFARIEGGAGYSIVAPADGGAISRSAALLVNTTGGQDFGVVGYTTQSSVGAGLYGLNLSASAGAGVMARGPIGAYAVSSTASGSAVFAAAEQAGYALDAQGRVQINASSGSALTVTTSSGNAGVVTTSDGGGDGLRVSAPAGGANAQIRLRTAASSAGRGVLLRHDGAAFYVLFTALNDANGVWTAARPLTVDLATGGVTVSQLALRDMGFLGAGAAAASFTGTKPGAPTTNNWMQISINGQVWLLPAWPLN